MKKIDADFAPSRILAIQLRQIGDVLLTTPALRALRRRFPSARISFLVEPVPAGVLEGNSHLDELLIRDPKAGGLEPLRTIGRVRRAGFELVVDFMGNPRTALLSALSGAKVTICSAANRRSWLYTHPVAPLGVFSAAQKASLLRVLSAEPDSMELDMAVPARVEAKIGAWMAASGLEGRRPLVWLEPFQKWEALTYSAAGFIRLGELMVQRWGATVVVGWGPGREAEARAIVAGSGAGLTLAPATDLHELAACYRRADLWVGVDGGPRHIAASQRLPTFAILGPSDQAWTPPGPRHLSVHRTDLPCLPCDRRVCSVPGHPCMRAYPAEQVFELLDAFWRRLAGAAGTGG